MRIKMAVYVCGGCGNTVMIAPDNSAHVRDEDNNVEPIGFCGIVFQKDDGAEPEPCTATMSFVGYTTLHSEPA